MHVIAAKAICFKLAMQDDFITYQKQVKKNASVLAQALMERDYQLVSGGTDNHLMLVDLRNKNITGKEAEKALEKAGITVNKNTVPLIPNPYGYQWYPYWYTGYDHSWYERKEMLQIAELIDRVLSDIDNEKASQEVHQDVVKLCQQFVS